MLSYGDKTLGVRVSVASRLAGDDQSTPPGELVLDAMYTAQRMVEDAWKQQLYLADPAVVQLIARQKSELLGLFQGVTIYVEEIPCDYGPPNHPWFSLFPWFKITTPAGRFTVGWRKRVISIDWEDSVVDFSAEQLFPTEDVTKHGRLIHTRSIEDARRYILRVLEAGGVVLPSPVAESVTEPAPE